MELLLVILSLCAAWSSGFYAGCKGDDASPSYVTVMMMIAYLLILAAFNV